DQPTVAPWNPGGLTPTMVAVAPSRINGCPTADGLRENRRSQKPSLITAPSGAPGSSSGCASSRPAEGRNPSASKNPPVTSVPGTFAIDSPEPTVKVVAENPPRLRNTSRSSASARTIAYESWGPDHNRPDPGLPGPSGSSLTSTSSCGLGTGSDRSS